MRRRAPDPETQRNFKLREAELITDTIKFWSLTRRTLLGEDSARRLALGVTFGMIIGLIPKDSLFAYVVFVLLMVSTANLWCALVSGFVFSWVGFLLDPFSHKLGGLMLTADRLEPAWSTIYEWPLMPWTRFNNTVVMGSLIVGLILAYPVYRLSFQFFKTFGHALHLKLQSNWIYRWLVVPTPQTPAKEGP